MVEAPVKGGVAPGGEGEGSMRDASSEDEGGSKTMEGSDAALGSETDKERWWGVAGLSAGELLVVPAADAAAEAEADAGSSAAVTLMVVDALDLAAGEVETAGFSSVSSLPSEMAFCKFWNEL